MSRRPQVQPPVKPWAYPGQRNTVASLASVAAGLKTSGRQHGGAGKHQGRLFEPAPPLVADVVKRRWKRKGRLGTDKGLHRLGGSLEALQLTNHLFRPNWRSRISQTGGCARIFFTWSQGGLSPIRLCCVDGRPQKSFHYGYRTLVVQLVVALPLYVDGPEYPE